MKLSQAKMDTPSTHFNTDSSMEESGGVKLVLRTQTPSFMWNDTVVQVFTMC